MLFPWHGVQVTANLRSPRATEESRSAGAVGFTSVAASTSRPGSGSRPTVATLAVSGSRIETFCGTMTTDQRMSRIG